VSPQVDPAIAEIVARVEGDGSPQGRLARAVQLAVPASARFLVASPEQDVLQQLEAARADGVHYLVLPHDGEGPPGLGVEEPLRAGYRLVVDEDVCAVFALQPAVEPGGPARDGLPLPPPEHIGLTMGIFDAPGMYEGYMKTGADDAQAIRETVRRSGPGVRRLGRLLEFGCGCARVLRHWSYLRDTEVHGSDFNPHMIDWCRRSLPFAQLTLNGVAPPLAYEDESFDLVYAVSVFTHQPEPLQAAWLSELARVVRQGGRLVLSLNGEQGADALLSGDDRARFDAGELVVILAERAGSNACTAFHPTGYRERFAAAAGLEIVAERPDAACNNGQDLLVLHRP
jgi:SAM-dependent methyltransferase